MTPKEKAWSIFWNFKNIPDKWKNEKVFQIIMQNNVLY